MVTIELEELRNVISSLTDQADHLEDFVDETDDVDINKVAFEIKSRILDLEELIKNGKS